MKKLIFVFVLCLFMIGGFTNCRKTGSEHLSIPQLEKDLAVFNKNSYWVYLNESTTKLDCTYVNNDPRFYSYTAQDGSSVTDNIVVPFEGNYFFDEYLSGSFLGILLDAPIVHLNGIAAYAPNIVERFDSLCVNNNKFLNVYRTHYSSLTAHYDSVILDTYMVPHLGIIKLTKKTLGTDTTLSIVRWKVSQ